jgi:hypothetical protein
MNPTVRPAIDDIAASRFKKNVDGTSLIIIRKGKTTPIMSRARAMATSFGAFLISPLYL